MSVIAPTLCALALSSFASDLQPLPGERGLQARERIAFEFARLQSPQLGLIGWTKTEIQRGEVDGATQFLVTRYAELANLEGIGFWTLEQRGLYTEDLLLIHERQRSAPFGGEGDAIELKWEDDGFRWREGRGKWTAVEGDRRVTAETDIALLVHGLSMQCPWEGYVFDLDRRALEVRTLRRGDEKDTDDFTGTEYLVEAKRPQRHQVRDDGEFFCSKMEGFDINYAERGDGSDLGFRRELADSEILAKLLDQRASPSWRQDGRELKSALLGLSLELPKGWTRLPDVETEGVPFYAISPGKDAYITIIVTLLGSGYSFEGWAEGLQEAYTELDGNEKVKKSKKKFARQDAVRFEMVASDAAGKFETTAYAWKRNGLGMVVTVGSKVDGPKKLARETGQLLKSVKVE